MTCRTEIIEFTLPYIVAGIEIRDFDVAVEVDITYRGKPSSFHSPAEGPEWNEGAYFVDAGCWDRIRKKHMAVWRPLDRNEEDEADLFRRMDRYLDSREGREDICARVYDALANAEEMGFDRKYDEMRDRRLMGDTP